MNQLFVKQDVPDDTRWKQILDFPNYWVSDRGHVFSMKRKTLMTISINSTGVEYVNMRGVGKVGGRSVGKLVRTYFGQDD